MYLESLVHGLTSRNNARLRSSIEPLPSTLSIPILSSTGMMIPYLKTDK